MTFQKDGKRRGRCTLAELGLLLISATVRPAVFGAGEGLSVQPGELRLCDVPLGERISFYEKHNLPLSIFNNSSRRETYMVGPMSFSRIGKTASTEGYCDLPDPGWLTVQPKEIAVEPHSRGEVRMYLTIPRDNRYYNQHWVVSIDIHSVPRPGSMISLALYPRVYIETQSRADTKATPAGVLGIKPSILQTKVAKGIPKEVGHVRVYNNDKAAHTYRVTTEGAQGRREPSRDYQWLSDPAMVQVVPTMVTLAPGKSAEVAVYAQVPVPPSGATGRREALVFIRDEAGHASFVRVRLDISAGK